MSIVLSAVCLSRIVLLRDLGRNNVHGPSEAWQFASADAGCPQLCKNLVFPACVPGPANQPGGAGGVDYRHAGTSLEAWQAHGHAHHVKKPGIMNCWWQSCPETKSGDSSFTQQPKAALVRFVTKNKW